MTFNASLCGKDCRQALRQADVRLNNRYGGDND
jgi:hypothetical protein